MNTLSINLGDFQELNVSEVMDIIGGADINKILAGISCVAAGIGMYAVAIASAAVCPPAAIASFYAAGPTTAYGMAVLITGLAK